MMAKFRVCAQFVTKSDKWECTHQVPTFYLDPDIQGFGDTAGDAERYASHFIHSILGQKVPVYACAVREERD